MKPEIEAGHAEAGPEGDFFIGIFGGLGGIPPITHGSFEASAMVDLERTGGLFRRGFRVGDLAAVAIGVDGDSSDIAGDHESEDRSWDTEGHDEGWVRGWKE